ncbi:MAG: DUF5317 family protein [Acidimicrobiales bacterium]
MAADSPIGRAAAARPRSMAVRPLRMWPLLGAGLALQVLVGRVDGAEFASLVASYALLLAFAVANVATVGMWMVATGVAMNLAAIALNAGMPVRAEALVAAGLADHGRAGDVRLAAKHHLERPSDRVRALGDIIPVRALGEVVSFGDVVLAVGAANVVARLLAPAPRRIHSARRRRTAQFARTTW